jgi:hydrogenase expression/formation protein HypC
LLAFEPPFTAGVVEFAGVHRQVSLACVPEAKKGDYVLVHAGIAISRIDADEAAKVLATLDALDLGDDDSDESTFGGDGVRVQSNVGSSTQI